LVEISNEGYFTLQAETVFIPIVPRMETELLRHHNLHSLPAFYKYCKFGGNRSVKKGTLLLRPKQFCPYLISNVTGVTETVQLAFPASFLHALQVWAKSVSNEGHFTDEQVTIFCPYLSSHCCGITETAYDAVTASAVQAMHVWSKLVSNEGYFILEVESF
jgi:hypothetical protein